MHHASPTSPAHVAVYSDITKKSFSATCQVNPVRQHLLAPLRAPIEAPVPPVPARVELPVVQLFNEHDSSSRKDFNKPAR
jgi:hypothetical protein